MQETQPQEPTAAPELSPADFVRQHIAFREQEWANVADAERTRIAKARGMFKDPSVQITLEELRAAVPLQGDTMRYAKDKAGNPRMALTKHGFPAGPKGRGRQNPHMTKTAQAIKSRAIIVFRGLFNKRIAELEKAAVASGETFNGIPTADLGPLGARATMIAAGYFRRDFKAGKRAARNRKKLSRAINAGIVPGNTNVARYIN